MKGSLSKEMKGSMSLKIEVVPVYRRLGFPVSIEVKDFLSLSR